MGRICDERDVPDDGGHDVRLAALIVLILVLGLLVARVALARDADPSS
jgi:hypothetical protein